MYGNHNLVYWSVTECNRKNAGRSKSVNRRCPECGEDNWYLYHGVDDRYRSEYNPGEYVRFTCAHCAYTEENQC